MPEPDMSDRVTGTGGGAPGLGGGAGLAGLANMFGGGGGGGAGGMPDLASMMNNPMLMQMAQNMMANGGMEELMRNPALQNMVRVRLGTLCTQHFRLNFSFRDRQAECKVGTCRPCRR